MSVDRSTAIARALAVPDPRLADSDALWTAQTTWPEQSPRPGRPVDQGDSSLVLAAYGERSSETPIELRTTVAGSIDPLTGAGFAWRLENDPLYRGQVAPSSIWGWDTIHYVDGSSTVVGSVTASKHPHARTTSDGTVLVCSQVSRYNTGESIQVSRFNEATGTWTTVNVLTLASAPTQDFEPCLCIVERPQGDRVVLFHWTEDTVSKTIQVSMLYSDDSGATWATGSTGCLREPLYDGEVAGRRLRASYRNGQVILFAELVGQDPADAARTNNHIVQWASIDDGATFNLVKNGQNVESLEGAFPDVVATPTGFVLVYVSIDSNGSEPYTQLRRIPDAFTPFSASPRFVAVGDNAAGTGAFTEAGYLQVAMGDLGSSQVRQVPASGAVASSKYTFDQFGGDITLATAPNGTIYLLQRAVEEYTNLAGSTVSTGGPKNETVVNRSTDGGLTWDTMGKSDVFQMVELSGGRPDQDLPGSGVLWRSKDENTFLRNLAATWWHGRLMVAHQWSANPGNEDSSVCVMALGGHSTVTLPRTAIRRDETSMAAWIQTWLPVELPGDTTGWTAAGAGSDTLQNGAVRLVTSSSARNYTNTDVGSGYIVRASLSMVSGSLIGATRVAIELSQGSVQNYRVEVRFATNAISLYDVNGSALIGSAVTFDTTTGVDVVVSLQGGTAALWYRAKGISDDLKYTAGPTGSATSSGSGSTFIKWGVIGSDSASVDWHELHFTRGGTTGITDYAGQQFEQLAAMTNPADLNAIVHSPTGVYVADGVNVRATGGPALEGDEHVIGSDSDFPVSRVFPAVFPSPRRGTRTVDDNTEATIAVAYDTKSALAGWNSAPLSDSMALAIQGANWRTGFIERYNAATNAWVTVVTIDMAYDLAWLANTWTLYGASIVADGTLASATQTYLEPNELAGSTLELGSGKLRRIARNTEGSTRPTLAGRKAVVTFEGADGTESTSVVRFWMKDAVIWWNNLGTESQGWRLRIPAQDTVDGDLRVGTLNWCNVHAFGTPYSFGRALGQEHGVQVVEAEDRTYRTRTLAPSRRSVTIGWSDGVPTCNASGESPDPDYVKLSDSAGALPVASSFDLPMTLRGLAEQVNGPALPVVYLPRLEKGPPDATVLNRRRDFLVGVIDSDIRLDTVQGDENEDEFIRVASMTIQEVV